MEEREKVFADMITACAHAWNYLGKLVHIREVI